MDPRAAFRQCLLDLDINGVRRWWREANPNLPEPGNDFEATLAMHLARVGMRNISPSAKKYSEDWLRERHVGRVALAVGIALMAPLRRRAHAEIVREAMQDSVLESVKAGIDLDKDAAEVKRRMLKARDKEGMRGIVGHGRRRIGR